MEKERKKQLQIRHETIVHQNVISKGFKRKTKRRAKTIFNE